MLAQRSAGSYRPQMQPVKDRLARRSAIGSRLNFVLAVLGSQFFILAGRRGTDERLADGVLVPVE